jgi:hypothetical protein
MEEERMEKERVAKDDGRYIFSSSFEKEEGAGDGESS